MPMTATEELRRLLDDAGVEWGNVRNDGSPSDYVTELELGNRDSAIATEWAVGGGLSVEICRHQLTPTQAVEATLGRGKCRNASYRLDESRFHCSECGFGCWVKDVADGYDKLPQYCPRCGREVER